jgi:hypothetical protein
MNTIASLAKAYALAAQWHTPQRRKGEAAEPYVNRLAEVAHPGSTLPLCTILNSPPPGSSGPEREYLAGREVLWQGCEASARSSSCVDAIADDLKKAPPKSRDL